MQLSRAHALALLAAIVSLSPAVARAELVVSGLAPARHSMAPVTTTVSVDFDRAVAPGSVTASSFRVFGRWSGPKSGPFTFSNGDKTVTLTPDEPFSAGETVTIFLARTITAADASTLRSAGYSWQFTVATEPRTPSFQVLDVLGNRSPPSAQTRIYGALAADLDDDGWMDLTTVNEVSADLRVFLNLGDGTGNFDHDFLAPVPIGQEGSPNESGDFNNDGIVDVAVSAASTSSVWIAIGLGDGTFQTPFELPSGSISHGIGVLDADGDGDPDLVNANSSSNNVAVFLNNGNGSYGAASFFEAGVGGEYGLGTGDMDGDGILDVVVGGLDSDEVVVALGNGDGTFTPQTPRDAMGSIWQLALGDVDGDGNLDVATANSFEGTGTILRGNGNGSLAPAETIATGNFSIASDLGDLDGDGDLDWVVSNYGSATWRIMLNDGSGSFAVAQDVPAPQAGSCAVLFDLDNDLDLDIGLIDELDDTVTLMKNVGAGVLSPRCPAAPAGSCRLPIAPGKAQIQLVDRIPDTKDRLVWRWTKGDTTLKAEYGDPATSESYVLCVYDAGELVSSAEVDAGGTCSGKPCWKETRTGFVYRDRTVASDGVQAFQVKEGTAPGKTTQSLTAKGDDVIMPALGPLTGPLQVQLHQSSGVVCWGATFSPPFLKDDGVTLKAKSD